MKQTFTTKSKSNYERLIREFITREIKYKGFQDDWNCWFTLEYESDKLFGFDKYNRLQIIESECEK